MGNSKTTPAVKTGFGALSSSGNSLFGNSSSSNAFAKMNSGGTSAWGTKTSSNGFGSSNVGGFSWLKKSEEKKNEDDVENDKKNEKLEGTEKSDMSLTRTDTAGSIGKQFGEDRDECKLELVEVQTGEEDEIPVIETMAKLYYFDQDNKTYLERGVGKLRLLDPKNSDVNRYSSRLTMRGTGTHRLVLNTLIWSKMCFERTAQPNTLRMSAKHWETGEIGIYLLRTNEKMANELYKAIDYRLNRLKHLVERVSLEENQEKNKNILVGTPETNNESSQNENHESTEDDGELEESSQASSQPENNNFTSSQEDSISRTSTQMSAQRINTSSQESNES